MSTASVAGVLIAGFVTAAILVAGTRRVLRRRSPAAHLAVAVLVVAQSGWPWPAVGRPFWADGVVALTWLLLFLTYPDGSVRPRWAMALLAGFVVLDIVVTVSGGLELWLLPIALALLLTGIGCQLWRYSRRASAAEREAGRWLLLGLLPFLSFCLSLAVVSALPWTSPGFVEADPVLRVAAVGVDWLVPLAAAAGLLMPSWLGLDRLVRTVSVVSGTAFVLALLFAFALPSVGPVWAAAVALAASWPVGWVVARGSDRLVYGRARRPVFSDLDARLDGTIGADEVGEVIAAAVVEELAVPFASVTDASRTAPRGIMIDGLALECFPIVYRGDEVATLVVAARRGDARLTHRDRVLITQLARSAAAALHGAAMLHEVRDARQRAVHAAAEERRRLRRELHDDIAPSVSGLGLKTAAASALARTDPVRAAQVMAEIEDGLTELGEQTRRLAYGLRPAVLDDRGIAAAIEERVAASSAGSGSGSGSGVRVSVDAPHGRMPLPAAVETAALRIAQEAVNNVRRHACAANCVVSLRPDSDRLVIRISDDGRGLPSPLPPGMGIPSIRERAAEIGGSVQLESDQGGTTVTAILPIAREMEMSRG